MSKEKLLNYIKSKRSTLLGVGPMSLNCVDAVIEISNHEKIPLMLIASRRQIDSEYFSNSIVNHFSLISNVIMRQFLTKARRVVKNKSTFSRYKVLKLVKSNFMNLRFSTTRKGLTLVKW